MVARECALAFAGTAVDARVAAQGSDLGSQIPSNLVSDVPVAHGEWRERILMFLCRFWKLAALKLADKSEVILLFLGKTNQQLRTLWSGFVADCCTTEEIVQHTMPAFVPQG